MQGPECKSRLVILATLNFVLLNLLSSQLFFSSSPMHGRSILMTVRYYVPPYSIVTLFVLRIIRDVHIYDSTTLDTLH